MRSIAAGVLAVNREDEPGEQHEHDITMRYRDEIAMEAVVMLIRGMIPRWIGSAASSSKGGALPTNVYVYDHLIIGFQGTIWREPGPSADKLSMVVSVRNPVGSHDSTRELPTVELRDSAGRAFAAMNPDSRELLPPYSETTCQFEFEIASDAEDLELVLGPGEPDEVHAPVQATAWESPVRETNLPAFE